MKNEYNRLYSVVVVQKKLIANSNGVHNIHKIHIASSKYSIKNLFRIRSNGRTSAFLVSLWHFAPMQYTHSAVSLFYCLRS